ncbi:hypothetical protein ACFRKE_16340 [Kitasatospora indigofera]|uniref:hypothetical protein n=1 Tax=Kitasatospora indigofera TaxID=67307 RepID=UPI00369CA61E
MHRPVLTIADEVVARIGAQKADELRERTRTFTCCECGAPGRADREEASVVLVASSVLSRLGVAHHRCSGSRAVDVGPGEITFSGPTDLVPRAIGLHTTSGDRAALLLAYEEDVTAYDESGAGYEPVVSHFLAAGLHRLVSLGRAPAASPRWSVEAGPGDRLVVTSGREAVLSDATMYAPSVWLAMAADQGAVALIVGRLDRDDIYAPAPPMAAYAAAIRSGRLVGGTVPITVR